MPSSKTIILAAMPNNLGSIHLNPSLQSSPAFRKTIVPGGPGKSLLGIRPAIATLQNRSNLLNKPVSIEIKLENPLEEDYESQSSRKRQRLDHLTMEEKLMRRKLKNRVAAQTARDRKKARMDELEDLVTNLEKQVDHLRSENGRLHNMTLLLESENTLLKEKLETKDAVVAEEVKVKRELKDDEVTGKTVDSIEHAEGAGFDDLSSLDEALRFLASDNNEPDDLFDFLQQCSQDLFNCALEENSRKPEEKSDGEPVTKRRRSESSQDTTVVGTTTEELESIKELIRFDHVYSKERTDVEIEEAVVEIVDSDPSEHEGSRLESIPTVGQNTSPSIIISSNLPLTEMTQDLNSDGKIAMDTTDNFHLKPNHLDCNRFLNSPSGSSGNESGYESPKSPFSDSSLLDEPEDWELSDLFPGLI